MSPPTGKLPRDGRWPFFVRPIPALTLFSVALTGLTRQDAPSG
jgi:hypothetical protein